MYISTHEVPPDALKNLKIIAKFTCNNSSNNFSKQALQCGNTSAYEFAQYSSGIYTPTSSVFQIAIDVNYYKNYLSYFIT
jgi:hypothetical protein